MSWYFWRNIAVGSPTSARLWEELRMEAEGNSNIELFVHPVIRLCARFRFWYCSFKGVNLVETMKGTTDGDPPTQPFFHLSCNWFNYLLFQLFFDHWLLFTHFQSTCYTFVSLLWPASHWSMKKPPAYLSGWTTDVSTHIRKQRSSFKWHL